MGHSLDAENAGKEPVVAHGSWENNHGGWPGSIIPHEHRGDRTAPRKIFLSRSGFGRDRIEHTLLQIRERKPTVASAKEFSSLARYYRAQHQVFVSFCTERLKEIVYDRACCCADNARPSPITNPRPCDQVVSRRQEVLSAAVIGLLCDKLLLLTLMLVFH